jgi:molecular chaperone GrpE
MSVDEPKGSTLPIAAEPEAAEAAVATSAEPGTTTVEEDLRRQVAEKTAEAAAHYDRVLRERAELENFKKRMQRDKAEALRFACEPLMRELLPIIDNLERALEHGAQSGESLVEGVRLVHKGLLDALSRNGAQRIEALGQPFDPARHQAIATAATTECEPNVVVAQHHTGYLLHDRLLRPAMVTVSTRPVAAAVESVENSD